MDPRRRVPRTDTLLADPRLAGAVRRLGRALVKQAVGEAQERARRGEIRPEQVADAAITRFAAEHPELRKAEIPPPLKWAGMVVASLFTAGTATLAFWLISTVNEMQVTLARMDERMASGTVKDARFDDLERRVANLEKEQVR